MGHNDLLEVDSCDQVTLRTALLISFPRRVEGRAYERLRVRGDANEGRCQTLNATASDGSSSLISFLHLIEMILDGALRLERHPLML